MMSGDKSVKPSNYSRYNALRKLATDTKSINDSITLRFSFGREVSAFEVEGGEDMK